MRLRPRCRSWLPLSTQQLRLRNLTRIEGVNIKCEEAGADIYYTLHQSIDEDPFYISEYLPHRQEQKWAEIICPKLFKSNDRSVCVKVRARLLTGLEDAEQAKQNAKASLEVLRLRNLTNGLPNTCINSYEHSSYQDKLLFTWGINFSGLLPLSEKKIGRYVVNYLIFHMNGECFTAAYRLISDSSVHDMSLRTEEDSFEFNQLNTKDDCKCELEKICLPCSLCRRDPEDTYKYAVSARYVQLYFKSSDVRRSYNLKQLLNLQGNQRSQLQRTRESKDLTVGIQRRSLYCITKDNIGFPQTALLSSSLSRYQQRLTMGRALSELFSEQSQINPHSLLLAQKLKKQIEALRLKHRLIQSECDTYTSRIAEQRNLLSSLIETSQKRQSWLRSSNQQLQVEYKLLGEQYQDQNILKQKRNAVLRDMERRMSALCVGLREIYPIERHASGLNTINNVQFPSVDAFVNGVKNGWATGSADNILPITLSVSLGYIAHLVQMISLIINRPLRNAVIHQGSRSRIIDVVKEIPFTCSQFPLYSRTSIPSKSVKYAILLLNQNIAQLCYDITGLRCDMRLTLDNIHQIFTYLSEIQNSDENQYTTDIYHNKRFPLKFNTCKNVGNVCVNIANDQLSRSQSSVDINHMPFPLTTVTPENSFLQLPSSMPLSIANGCIFRPRVCRSVGSYSGSEEDFEDIHSHVYSNSDSNIAMMPSHI